jgi:hypothetical protein
VAVGTIAAGFDWAAGADMVGLFFGPPAAAIGTSTALTAPAGAEDPLPGLSRPEIGATEREARTSSRACPDLVIE